MKEKLKDYLAILILSPLLLLLIPLLVIIQIDRVFMWAWNRGSE